MVEAVNAYLLIEKHAIQIATALKGLNSEQWAIRVTIEDEKGRAIETALRIVYKD